METEKQREVVVHLEKFTSCGVLTHAADLLGLDGDDDPHLVAAPEPGVWPAQVLLGELLDVLRRALCGDVDYPAAHLEVAPGFVGVGDGDGYARVALYIPDLEEAPHAVYEDALAVGVDPGLGELGRAVDHRGGDVACARTVQQL